MYKIWDKQSGFNLADGTACTIDEIYKRYPFTKSGTIALELLPSGNVGGIDSLDILKQVYKIADDFGTDDEVLAEVERIKALPPEPVADPVEAKLDYLIMLS